MGSSRRRTSKRSFCSNVRADGTLEDHTDLQCGEHLTLLFAVEQAVVVLHRDEGCEVVRDRVVCRFLKSETQH